MTVVVSCGMGSRSFTNSNIIAVVDCNDGGSMDGSVQRGSRMLSDGAGKECGLLVNYSFDTTRSSKYEIDLFTCALDESNGDFEKAKSQFEKGIKASPDFPPSYRYLGDVYEQTRELVKALENWEKYAFKELEKGKVIYSKIESALFDLGRYSEVEKFYRKILDLKPTNFEATIRLAYVLEEKGESGLEEERRLAYVAITRAKKLAKIANAGSKQ